jgi:hypothetical protein
LCPAKLRDEQVLFVTFGPKIIAKAIKERPNIHYDYLKSKEKQSYSYKDEIYEEISNNNLYIK